MNLLNSSRSPTKNTQRKKGEAKKKKVVEGIIESEDRAEGGISFAVFKNWIMLSGGFLFFLFVFATLSVISVASAGSIWFMQGLASRYAIHDKPIPTQFTMFFFPYLGIVAALILATLIKLILIFHGNVKMSLEVNFRMTFKTIHASVNKYFDRIPIGRILNRFIADVQVVDTEFPWSTEIVLSAV